MVWLVVVVVLEEGERSCRSCQKSQLWTRGGARFFCRRAWRKLRISAPRAGGVVVVVWGPGGERVGLGWEAIFAVLLLVVDAVVVWCLFWPGHWKSDIRCRVEMTRRLVQRRAGSRLRVQGRLSWVSLFGV